MAENERARVLGVTSSVLASPRLDSPQLVSMDWDARRGEVMRDEKRRAVARGGEARRGVR